MYEAAHSGTWLRGRLTEVSRLLINLSCVSTHFLPNFMLCRSFDKKTKKEEVSVDGMTVAR